MTGETENLGAPSHAPDPEPPPNGLTLTCLIFLTVSLFSITRDELWVSPQGPLPFYTF